MPLPKSIKRMLEAKTPHYQKSKTPERRNTNPQDLEVIALLVVVTLLPFLVMSSQHPSLPMPIHVSRFVVFDLGAPKDISTRSRKVTFIMRTNLRQMVGGWAACVASEYALAASLGRPV
ncbi:hypothetical protein CFIO01_05955 [Colletotrichum fioriniae PJ7]|uniref:Uncharacterized protein n=1 Tax=Colletotrichum fioriniae PJ7 TaxID=1445577 RepID=A0A010R074_9PEZI|nr:hypothetical protein CFIO01_05955 [Colletotrichum fioriniae PJ7]